MSNKTNRPTSVRIGYHVYAIKELTEEVRQEWKDEGDNEFWKTGTGRISERFSEIHIDFTKGPAEAANVLLHEIMHGICYQSGSGHVKKNDGEYIIIMFSNGLIQVMQDNKEVFDWIVENAQLPIAPEAFITNKIAERMWTENKERLARSGPQGSVVWVPDGNPETLKQALSDIDAKQQTPLDPNTLVGDDVVIGDHVLMSDGKNITKKSVLVHDEESRERIKNARARQILESAKNAPGRAEEEAKLLKEVERLVPRKVEPPMSQDEKDQEDIEDRMNRHGGKSLSTEEQELAILSHYKMQLSADQKNRYLELMEKYPIPCASYITDKARETITVSGELSHPSGHFRF